MFRSQRSSGRVLGHSVFSQPSCQIALKLGFQLLHFPGLLHRCAGHSTDDLAPRRATLPTPRRKRSPISARRRWCRASVLLRAVNTIGGVLGAAGAGGGEQDSPLVAGASLIAGVPAQCIIGDDDESVLTNESAAREARRFSTTARETTSDRGGNRRMAPLALKVLLDTPVRPSAAQLGVFLYGDRFRGFSCGAGARRGNPRRISPTLGSTNYHSSGGIDKLPPARYQQSMDNSST